jgi:enamine deaminase RidA (YjgF/YER057c/UK114 family)
MEKYSIYLPTQEGSIESQWQQCLKQIKENNLVDKDLAKLNIFIDADDYTQYKLINDHISKSVTDTFGSFCPVFGITVHPPEKPWKVAVEAGYVKSGTYSIISKKWNNVTYLVRTKKSVKEVMAYGLGSDTEPVDILSSCNRAFDIMKAIVESEGMSFDNLVRQWNYIGKILGTEDEFQNYQVFNEIRNENYRMHRKTSGYPAATGIGMKLDGVIIDFFAISDKESHPVIPIENPDQVNPYAYEQKVLKGNPLSGRSDKHPPQFERAVLTGNNLFISGTASIIGQDTIGKGDIEKQTVVTIENILKLYRSNKIPHENDKSSELDMELIILRVYIKSQKDFDIVKSICNSYFPGVPAIYIEADICRDDLLVEIEAEYLILK